MNYHGPPEKSFKLFKNFNNIFVFKPFKTKTLYCIHLFFFFKIQNSLLPCNVISCFKLYVHKSFMKRY